MRRFARWSFQHLGGTVTVCIAAMCSGPFIIGASDRMLTAGDIQFEPFSPKIDALTNSIVVMVAGDIGLQSIILQSIREEIKQRLAKDPITWLPVKDIAEMYRVAYNQERARQAEQAILAPLGLSTSSFITQQRELSPELVNQIATELLNFRTQSVEALVVGIDNSGSHIFAVNDGAVTSNDTIGFAAIGIGSWHANSQLMFAGHSRLYELPETMLVTYSAKRRAEVAPGVGKGTDMFMIGTQPGSYTPIRPGVLDELKKIYDKSFGDEQRAAAKARERITTYVDKIIQAASAQQQVEQTKDSSGSPPAAETQPEKAPNAASGDSKAPEREKTD
jgi:20S proteasome alpha/beta subunit